MKISVIPAHLHQGSFNHAIADEAAAVFRNSGHTVTLHDLYREGFDPLLQPGTRIFRFRRLRAPDYPDAGATTWSVHSATFFRIASLV